MGRVAEIWRRYSAAASNTMLRALGGRHYAFAAVANPKIQAAISVGSILLAIYSYWDASKQAEMDRAVIDGLRAELRKTYDVIEELERTTSQLRADDNARSGRRRAALARIEYLPQKIESDLFSDIEVTRDVEGDINDYEYTVSSAVALSHDRFVVILKKYYETGWMRHGQSGDEALLGVLDGDILQLYEDGFLGTSHDLEVADEEIVFVETMTGLTYAKFPRQFWSCRWRFDAEQMELTFLSVETGSSHLVSGPCQLSDGNGETINYSWFIYAEPSEHYMSNLMWSEEHGGYIDNVPRVGGIQSELFP